MTEQSTSHEPHVRLLELVRRVGAFIDARRVVEDAIPEGAFERNPERGERCLNALWEAQEDAKDRLEAYKLELGIS